MNIKSIKIIVLICSLSVAYTAEIKAFNPLAVVVGSVVATGGVFYGNVGIAALTNPLYALIAANKEKEEDEQERASKQVVIGAAATIVGLCLLAYGAGA